MFSFKKIAIEILKLYRLCRVVAIFVISLKTIDRQFDNFVVTGGTVSCHYDNLRCHHWQQSCQIWRPFVFRVWGRCHCHYCDVIMGAVSSQITSLTIVYSTVYSDADQRKHQSSASLAFVRGIHRGPVNSPHKWPVTRKMFPFDDVITVT